MFDAVLAGATVQRRWGSGVALTGMAHFAVFVIAVFLTRPAPHIERGVPDIVWPPSGLKNSITFATKPSAPSSSTATKTRTHATAMKPSARDLSPQVAAVTESSNFEESATAGIGTGNTTDIDTGLGDSPKGPIIFEGRMTHPQKISGPDPEYTTQALEKEVEGMMLVTCIVTTAGEVQNCRVVKGLQFLESSAIYALERRKYTPATLDGKPIDVEYTFRIPFVLPE